MQTAITTNEKQELDNSQLYTDKANEIKKILIGFNQQEIESILLLFKTISPTSLFLSPQ